MRYRTIKFSSSRKTKIQTHKNQNENCQIFYKLNIHTDVGQNSQRKDACSEKKRSNNGEHDHLFSPAPPSPSPASPSSHAESIPSSTTDCRCQKTHSKNVENITNMPRVVC